MVSVAIADARAGRGMVHFRFQRSTSTPAIGLMMIIGAKLKNATIESAVASPVVRYAHSVSAKPVIAVPTRDTTCPNQTMVNLSLIHISEPTRLGMISY